MFPSLSFFRDFCTLHANLRAYQLAVGSDGGAAVSHIQQHPRLLAWMLFQFSDGVFYIPSRTVFIRPFLSAKGISSIGAKYNSFK